MGSEWVTAATYEDGFEFEFEDDMWEYVGRDTEYDWMSSEYDRLCEVVEASRGNRRLRRDRRVVAAADQLERAAERLYNYGNGYSEFDYDQLNVSEWDELYPLADACFVALAAALIAVYELEAQLRDVVDASINSLPFNWLLPAEPPVRTSSVRSEPALAHAPPLSRVALFSDDVMAAAA